MIKQAIITVILLCSISILMNISSSKSELNNGELLKIAPFHFMGSVMAEGATFYKYTDKKGTLVITKDPNKVPPNYRESAKKIELPDEKKIQGDIQHKGKNKVMGKNENIENNGKNKGLGKARNILNKIKNKTLNKRWVRSSRENVLSFFQNQKYLAAGYVVGGAILFFIFSLILKKFIGSFAFRLLLKLLLMVALAAGAYIFYMSWLSKNILFLDQPMDLSRGSNSKIGGNKIFTPKDIIDRTKEAVNEINARTKKQEKILEELGKE